MSFLFLINRSELQLAPIFYPFNSRHANGFINRSSFRGILDNYHISSLSWDFLPMVYCFTKTIQHQFYRTVGCDHVSYQESNSHGFLVWKTTEHNANLNSNCFLDVFLPTSLIWIKDICHCGQPILEQVIAEFLLLTKNILAVTRLCALHVWASNRKAKSYPLDSMMMTTRCLMLKMLQHATITVQKWCALKKWWSSGCITGYNIFHDYCLQNSFHQSFYYHRKHMIFTRIIV